MSYDELSKVKFVAALKICNVFLLHFGYIVGIVKRIHLQSTDYWLTFWKIGLWVCGYASVDEGFEEIEANYGLLFLHRLEMGRDSEYKGCIVDVVMTHHQLNQFLLRHVFEQVILVDQRQYAMLVSSLALQPLRHHLSRLSSKLFEHLLALYSPD